MEDMFKVRWADIAEAMQEGPLFKVTLDLTHSDHYTCFHKALTRQRPSSCCISILVTHSMRPQSSSYGGHVARTCESLCRPRYALERMAWK